MMGLVNIIALFFIIVPSVAIGAFINWKQIKRGWWRFKWLVKRTWSLCKKITQFLWSLCKRLWVSSKRNPAIVLLVIAWVFIIIALYLFAPHLYKLYGILSKQIEIKQNSDIDYRGIAIRYFGIVAGAFAIIGYIFATGRNIILNTQNKISERGRITESMVQAITQIGTFNGKDLNVEVRLGGLYSLQHIMQDSLEHELTIARILYAYVRENIKRDRIKQSGKDEDLGVGIYQLTEDVQAVISIINQFNKTRIEEGRGILSDNQLDFIHTNFSGYSLETINFSHFILYKTNLSRVSLLGADLSDAFLYEANLYCADLSGADFTNAHLGFSNLSRANLADAEMENSKLIGTNLTDADLNSAVLIDVNGSSVNLRNANLKGTLLHGANLSSARNLTQEQINIARGDKDTKLPPDLTRPPHWK